MIIAVLGLGIIGSRAAANLETHSEHQIRIWNRTPKGLATEAGSLIEAVKDAQIVSLYVKDSDAVRSIIGQIQDTLPDGTFLVNHATVDLDTTRWVDSVSTERGWRFLDAPFTGSRDAAAAGQLVYYAGGAPETIEQLKSFLLQTGKEVIPCGPAGNATITKLVTNLISACTVQALSEALATATAHGIAPEAFQQAVAANACGSVLSAMKLPSMSKGDFTTHFSLDNMQKDSRYVRALAKGIDTPAIDAVSERMAELCATGLAELDYSALAAPYQTS